MAVVSEGQVKRISDCSLGEFIKAKSNNTTIYGFVIIDLPSESVKLIVNCDLGTSAIPTLEYLDYTDVCLSYGKEYILEPVIDVDPWKDSELAGKPGTLALWHDVQGLVFSEDGKSLVRIKIFDFKTNTVIDRDTRRAITITHWRIWADRDHMHTQNAKPVFQVAVRPLVELPPMIA